MAKVEQRDPHELLTAFVKQALKFKDDTVYMGIDPGAEGAIGFLCGRAYCVVDIPAFVVGRTGSKKLSEAEQARTGKKTKVVHGSKTLFDYDATVTLLRLVKPIKERIFVALEEGQVQVMGRGSNAYTGFRVGVAYGMWPLYLASRGWAREEFKPSKWKLAMGIKAPKGEKPTRTKERSRMKALREFPKAKPELARKSDHNRAEALLLTLHARKEREGTSRRRSKPN